MQATPLRPVAFERKLILNAEYEIQRSNKQTKFQLPKMIFRGFTELCSFNRKQVPYAIMTNGVNSFIVFFTKVQAFFKILG